MHSSYKRIITLAGGGTQYRMSPTARLVKDWFPANPVTFKHVRERFVLGEYQNNPAAFIDDLQRDLSLYTQCLRNFSRVKGAVVDPQRFADGLDAELFRPIVSANTGQMSAHKFSKMSNNQKAALRVAVASCSAASAVARRTNLDPRLAFVAMLMRQLGHLLTAWNHPRLYAKIVSAMRSGPVDFDAEVQRILGLSRLSLGSRLAQEWSIMPPLRSALTEGVRRPDLTEEVSLGQVVDIAEAVGWAASEFPVGDADQRREIAEEKLKPVLGASGYDVVLRDIVALLDSYPLPNQQPKPGDGGLDPRCPADLRTPMLEVLKKAVADQFSLEAVEALETILLPIAGFRSGYLFTLDPQLMKFHPVLRLGAPDSVRNPLEPSTHRALLDAVFNGAPLMREWESDTGRRVTHIAMGIQNQEEDAAVLYFELAPRFAQDRSRQHVEYFLAVTQCLRKCLGWSENNPDDSVTRR